MPSSSYYFKGAKLLNFMEDLFYAALSKVLRETALSAICASAAKICHGSGGKQVGRGAAQHGEATNFLIE